MILILQLRRAGFLLALFFILTIDCFSEPSPNPTVAGVLSKKESTLDDVISLRFVLDGESQVEPQKVVVADGLLVSLAGSDSYQDSKKRYVAWTYNIVPKTPGVHTIPSLTFRSGTREITSFPVKLIVLNQEELMITGTQAGFAELVLPGSTGQVGEPMLVALRFYYDAALFTVDSSPIGMKEMQKNGFKLSKTEYAGSVIVIRNERKYQAHTFLCEVIPEKSGKLIMAPATLDCKVSENVPEKKKNESNDPFEMFDKKASPAPKVKHLRLSTNQKEIQIRENGDAGQERANTSNP